MASLSLKCCDECHVAWLEAVGQVEPNGIVAA